MVPPGGSYRNMSAVEKLGSIPPYLNVFTKIVVTVDVDLSEILDRFELEEQL